MLAYVMSVHLLRNKLGDVLSRNDNQLVRETVQGTRNEFCK